jgi:hypothetical protein
MSSKEILAVDIGGPILNAKGGSTPAQYAAALPTAGGFNALLELGRLRFGNRIRLISQCNEEIQAVKLDWMARHEFFEATGISLDRIHFVREPAGKAEVCRTYGVTHFVEDRPLIMLYAMHDVPNLFLFRPDPAEAAKYPEVLARARVSGGWDDLLPYLLDEHVS